MNILFVCTANRDRSKTAEHHFKISKPQHEYKSCGISSSYCKTWGGTYIDRGLLDWADRIFCMDTNHQSFIRQKYGKDYDAKMINLKIEDIYNYMSEKLINILETKIQI